MNFNFKQATEAERLKAVWEAKERGQGYDEIAHNLGTNRGTVWQYLAVQRNLRDTPILEALHNGTLKFQATLAATKLSELGRKELMHLLDGGEQVTEEMVKEILASPGGKKEADNTSSDSNKGGGKNNRPPKTEEERRADRRRFNPPLVGKSKKSNGEAPRDAAGPPPDRRSANVTTNKLVVPVDGSERPITITINVHAGATMYLHFGGAASPAGEMAEEGKQLKKKSARKPTLPPPQIPLEDEATDSQDEVPLLENEDGDQDADNEEIEGEVRDYQRRLPANFPIRRQRKRAEVGAVGVDQTTVTAALKALAGATVNNKMGIFQDQLKALSKVDDKSLRLALIDGDVIPGVIVEQLGRVPLLAQRLVDPELKETADRIGVALAYSP